MCHFIRLRWADCILEYWSNTIATTCKFPGSIFGIIRQCHIMIMKWVGFAACARLVQVCRLFPSIAVPSFCCYWCCLFLANGIMRTLDWLFIAHYFIYWTVNSERITHCWKVVERIAVAEAAATAALSAPLYGSGFFFKTPPFPAQRAKAKWMRMWACATQRRDTIDDNERTNGRRKSSRLCVRGKKSAKNYVKAKARLLID